MRRAERAARNEALFRETNERIAHVAATLESETMTALCECSSPTCAETLEIRASAYEAVRSHGDRFALLEGHDDPSIERVVERGPGYVVVEKLGEGAEIARGLDPRA
jgi:hypothetical protein